MMKTKLLLLLFAVVFTTVNLRAYNFILDGIGYNITSSTSPYTVAVTSGGSTYTGAITIPASVSYNSISYSVTSIGDNAFNSCKGLTAVTIPNLVNSIGDQAFSGCIGLTSIAIPNSVTSIGDYAFYECTGLTSIIIPNTVITIGDFTFSGCKKITTFTIPPSVTSIGEFAFYKCTGLTSVTIHNSATSIKRYVFSDCTGLTTLYADSPTPIDLSSSPYVFNNVNTTTCTLYVPTGSKSLYAVADQWKDFTNITEHTVTGIATVSASKLNIRVIGRTVEIGLPEASAPVQVVDISGRQLYNGKPSGSTLSVTLPQAGIYLVRVGNKVTKLFAPCISTR